MRDLICSGQTSPKYLDGYFYFYFSRKIKGYFDFYTMSGFYHQKPVSAKHEA